MPMHRLCFHVPTKRLVIAGAMTLGLVTTASVSEAQELPTFRRGLWEFNRTIEGASAKTQTMATKKCTNPTDDMRKQNDTLTKAGCKFSPTARSGSAYSFSSQCNIQGISAHSKSVISPDGDSAYTVTIDSQQDGQATKEVLVARRIGDC